MNAIPVRLVVYVVECESANKIAELLIQGPGVKCNANIPLWILSVQIGSFEGQSNGLSRSCQATDPLRAVWTFHSRLLLPSVEVGYLTFNLFEHRTARV